MLLAAAVSAATALVAPLRLHATRSVVMMAREPQVFCRSTDLMSMRETVTDVEVVNVLGRWSSHRDWDTIGELVAMDKLFDSSGVPFKQLETWSEMVDGRRIGLTPEEKLSVSPARSPNRRAWCKRNGQAQRWWHNANVPLLRFKSPKLAASVGATVAEMNAMEVNPLAAEVVFDALSRSQSGIVDKATCDARRATYETADGAFDAPAFASDLAGARRTILKSYAIYPGSVNLIFGIAFIRADGYHKVIDYLDAFTAPMREGRLWS